MRRILMACAALVVMAMASPAAVQAAEQTPSCQATLNSYLVLIASTPEVQERIDRENVLLTQYLEKGCDSQAFVEGVMARVPQETKVLIAPFLGLDEHASNHEFFCARVVMINQLARLSMAFLAGDAEGDEQMRLLILRQQSLTKIGACNAMQPRE